MSHKQTGENTLSILLPPVHHFMSTYEHVFRFTFMPSKPGLVEVLITFPPVKDVTPSEGEVTMDALDASPASRYAARLTFADKDHTGSTTESDSEPESSVSRFQRLIDTAPSQKHLVELEECKESAKKRRRLTK